MSQIQSDGKHPLRRDNFWGGGTGSEDAVTGHVELDGTSWEEYVAHAILRKGTDQLCPHCLHTHDRVSVLSEPCEYVPKEFETSFGTVECYPVRHRRRVCPHPDCEANIQFGGVLADRETDEFLALVEDVLSSLDLPPKKHDKLYNDARSKKLDGCHDVEITTYLVQELGNP